MSRWIFRRVWGNYLWIVAILVIMGMANFAYAACTGSGIPNPISACNFLDLINALTTAIIEIGSVLAVVAIIWAGLKFITASSSGNTKNLEEARKMFWWVFVGTAIVVGSSALAQAVINTIKTLGT